MAGERGYRGEARAAQGGFFLSFPRSVCLTPGCLAAGGFLWGLLMMFFSHVVNIASKSIDYAKSNLNDIVIIDTAGRLHIDDVLMNELKSIKSTVNPIEIILVVDSMTGQDAVNVAEVFNNELDLTGIIMTKLDGDARGGAALSIKAITDKPIKFIGTGEKIDDLEPFYPDRMASRILGMGDILSVIDKVQKQFDLKQTKELEEKIRKQTFTLSDFLNQMR